MSEHEAVGTGLVVAGVVIFVVAYALIASDRVPKSAVALGGGTLMILIGILDQHHAFEHIDLNVILLLVGMMVLAGYCAPHWGVSGASDPGGALDRRRRRKTDAGAVA